jgi:transposase
MFKVDTRTLSRSDLDNLRARGAGIWRAGTPQAAVFRELGVRAATVSAWITAFRRGGESALATRTRSRKREELTETRGRRLRRKIEGKTPGQWRLDFALWTTDAVLAVIKRQCTTVVSKRTVHRSMYEWGYTPMKATKRAWQQDFVPVQGWIVGTYPRITARAKRCKGRIFWADET